MYLTTVKELGTALLTKGTAFALTQTATQTNNSSVNDVLDSAQEVTASTADEVNRFVQYFNDNIPNLIAFGLKVIFAIVFYLIGSKVISVIRKVVGKSMERSNADVGVRQFVDSMLKFGLYALLIFMIATKWRRIFFCSSDHRFRRCGNWSGITRESVELCRRYLDSSSQTICGWRLYYCEFRGNRRNCKGNSDLLYKDDNNR